MVDSICLSRFYLNMTKIGKEKKKLGEIISICDSFS